VLLRGPAAILLLLLLLLQGRGWVLLPVLQLTKLLLVP
jgi:hypothetical protein